MINETLKNYSKEQLIELIENYCKNWLAMDGVWFQSVEKNMVWMKLWNMTALFGKNLPS